MYVNDRSVPSAETLPASPIKYFKKDLNNDGIDDTVCVYEDRNTFYALGNNERKIGKKIFYNRVMPGSSEAEQVQKFYSNLE